ncbi:phage portal protein [Bifidobacterium oedipodis]|uniref:Phage portal protein gp6 n=1 Tax=Bifidobacterium oedipodis TaxID=2675322 RepID=A0A7Y0EP85_9BIFI|nr:phage portal protein [Bifidobacterium sp. DSM 109957]NMM93879.1 Phage portal protein gp6 [Bifidobacterium sp. DSM 109957]
MAKIKSLVVGDDEPHGDGMVLTRLANRLQARIPKLCELKTFYDGRESIPTKYVPKNMNTTSADVYRRFVDICPMNLASTIANAVITSQNPIGFRLVDDKSMRSTAADDMWDSTGMNVRALNMFMDMSLYGAAYAMVFPREYPSYIQRLSPWTTSVSPDKDSAVVYDFDADEGMEYLTLYRLIRDDKGEVVRVYSRTAQHETENRTLYSDSVDDEESVYSLANDEDAKLPALPQQFQWAGEAQDDTWEFAKQCGCLPVVRLATSTGKGVFESSLRTLSAIDQQRFQRFCIQEMQAFRQRWVSGDMPEYYAKSDPAVKYGHARAGDKIDYSELFEMGPAALWLMPKDAKVSESQVTDITPLVTAATSDIKNLAGATGTPLSILSPDVAGSAEGAKLTTRMLRMKVRDMNARANDAFVLLLRMALLADSQSDAAGQRFETIWEPLELPSELEQSQAAANLKGIIPVKTIMRHYLHFTETDISEAMRDAQDTMFMQALANENRMLETSSQSQSAATLPDSVSDDESLQYGSFDSLESAGESFEEVS